MLPNIIFKFILPHDASGNPNRILKKLTILSSIGMAILGITISPLVIPVFFPKFIEAIHVFQIVSLSIIPTTINITFVSKFLGMEKSRFVLVSSGVYLATQIILILILGSIYGINGVAIAYVASSIMQTITYLIIDRTIIRKNPP